MSIALDNNRIGGITGVGFLRRNEMPLCNLGVIDSDEDRTVERENEWSDECSSSVSSSIGNNSDDLEQGSGEEDDEVESKLKKNPLDSAVEALEQALPIRRGISKFYNGKSKSFASLGEAACTSIKDITKPENGYTRKRKNLLAYTLLYDKGHGSGFKAPGIGGGIGKRPIPSSRSTLALAVAMSQCEGIAGESRSSPDTYQSARTTLATATSHPSGWRSFSVADLQHCGCGVSVSAVKSCSLMEKRSKTDSIVGKESMCLHCMCMDE